MSEGAVMADPKPRPKSERRTDAGTRKGDSDVIEPDAPTNDPPPKLRSI